MAGLKSANREALERALIVNPEAVRLSNCLLGKMFGIGFEPVRKVRNRLEAVGLIPKVATRLCRDGNERNPDRFVWPSVQGGGVVSRRSRRGPWVSPGRGLCVHLPERGQCGTCGNEAAPIHVPSGHNTNLCSRCCPRCVPPPYFANSAAEDSGAVEECPWNAPR